MESDPVPIDALASSKGPGECPGLLFGLAIVLSLIVGGCSSKEATSCPGQFDPSGLSNAQLKNQELGRIPEQEATTRQSVTETIAQRRGWVERNYTAVRNVEVGQGWGLTYTRNEYGDIKFHRAPDFMIVTTVQTRSDCPDPDRGTLLIFGSDKLRVPVRFVYRSS